MTNSIIQDLEFNLLELHNTSLMLKQSKNINRIERTVIGIELNRAMLHIIKTISLLKSERDINDKI